MSKFQICFELQVYQYLKKKYINILQVTSMSICERGILIFYKLQVYKYLKQVCRYSKVCIKYINILKKYINIYQKKYIKIQNKYRDIFKK